MRQVKVCLDSVDRVQSFVKVLSGLDGDFEMISDKHILDARSLMGLFSLDLSRPNLLRVHNDCAENLDAIAPYLSEEGQS